MVQELVDLSAAEVRLRTLKCRRTQLARGPGADDLVRELEVELVYGLLHAYGAAAGVPLPTVVAVLGHAHLTTTALYTTATGAEVREFVARMWD